DSIQISTRHLPAPDFPTGGVILGTIGARQAYTSGRGRVVIRARTEIEDDGKDNPAIVVTEIPYQVNKSSLVERIAELARDKSIPGISGVQDESDRSGMRIVVQLRRDTSPEVILNQLYRQTALQTSFSCNMLALNAGRPELMDLRGFLSAFIEFRNEVVVRRTAFRLRKARERSHLLCGLAVAVANVDDVVAMIRSSASPAEARERLLERTWNVASIIEYIRLIDDPLHGVREDGTYRLSDTQVSAILELRLQRLTAMGVKDIGEELATLADQIRDFLDILGSRERALAIITDELNEVRKRFAQPRRSEIVDDTEELDDDDLIEREDMVVTVTNEGYIKRTALSEYREQKRGGKGLKGPATKETDFVTSVFVTDTHTPLLFFSTTGMVYRLKTWRLPQGGRNARGKAVVNILQIRQGDSIAAIMPESDHPDRDYMVFATRNGRIKINARTDFQNIWVNGKIGVGLRDGDSLIGVMTASRAEDILLTTSRGQIVRFPVKSIRVSKGRPSTGVRGIKLKRRDSIVSLAIIRHVELTVEERIAFARMRALAREQNGGEGEVARVDQPVSPLEDSRYAELLESEESILTITSKGFGKRTSAHEFRITARGGKGMKAANLKLRDDRIVASLTVEDHDQIMLMTSTGQSIRCPVSDIRRAGRVSAGVTVFRISGEEEVVSVARIVEPDRNGGETDDDGAKTPIRDGPA
ncbi:MAG: DNA gyrase subunit A, partial [Rhodobacteraceae bacterium]|nr:DNA gyrase subunit A [Paracoccaceae bacterium]